MRVPKIIKRPQDYSSNPYYLEYKYHKMVYSGCYEYIHWWQNSEGKWRCFKIYLEKGNALYYDWLRYLQGQITINLFEEFKYD